MILGFTGTREMPTRAQRRFIMLRVADASELHHGCCVGSDYVAHRSALWQCVSTIILHPPVDQRLMVPLGNLLTRGGIHVMNPKQYHTRNRDIVDESDAVIATPDGPRRPHSGTWYTIDYARGCGKPVVVCLPDGTIDPEGST